MKKFYFTFPVNHPLGTKVQRVDAVDDNSARKGMENYYGEHWAFCYPEGKRNAYETGEGQIVRISKNITKIRIQAIIYVDPYSGDIYCE